MTTSHRPQLEARNGAKSRPYVPTGIRHARLLPGHTQVKYRQRKRSAKQALSEETDNISKRLKDSEQEGDSNLDQTDGSDEYDEEEEEDKSEDEEALLEELNNVRQEKMLMKLKSQVAEPLKPKPNLNQESWRSNTVFGRKRNNKTNKDSSGGIRKSDYKNNIIESDYHKEFLRSFVK